MTSDILHVSAERPTVTEADFFLTVQKSKGKNHHLNSSWYAVQ